MLYLVGVPGSGKTTLARRLFRGVGGEVKKVPNVSWTEYSEDLCAIGHERETFGGTDALGMAAQNHVLAWLDSDEGSHRYVFAEGDRLANARFFEQVTEAGFDLTVVLLDMPPAVVERRRNKRNETIGKEQNETWLRGRETKVANIAHNWVDPDWRIRGKVDDMVRLLEKHPVGKAVKRLR